MRKQAIFYGGSGKTSCFLAAFSRESATPPVVHPSPNKPEVANVKSSSLLCCRYVGIELLCCHKRSRCCKKSNRFHHPRSDRAESRHVRHLDHMGSICERRTPGGQLRLSIQCHPAERAEPDRTRL